MPEFEPHPKISKLGNMSQLGANLGVAQYGRLPEFEHTQISANWETCPSWEQAWVWPNMETKTKKTRGLPEFESHPNISKLGNMKLGCGPIWKQRQKKACGLPEFESHPKVSKLGNMTQLGANLGVAQYGNKD